MGSEESQSDAVRTVECLRGRLLAEREASKAAKEEADLMNKRLSELERLLAAEVEARNRAEKRLNRALKKLESLKLDEIPGISEELRSRIAAASGSESPSSSASACTSGSQASEERKSCSQGEGSTQCGSEGVEEEGEEGEGSQRTEGGERDESLAAVSTESSVPRSASEEDGGDWSSVGTAQSVNNNNVDGACPEGTDSEKSMGRGDSTADANSTPPSISSEVHDEDDQQTEYLVDNTLALVPAGIWLKSGNSESSMDTKQSTVSNSESPRSRELQSPRSRELHCASQQGDSQPDNNVHDVLSALRLGKEQLRNSIHRRALSVCSPTELCG